MAATSRINGRFHLAALWHKGFVYAAGGVGAKGAASVEVWRAAFGADGVLQPWQPSTPLPGPRSHHGMLVRDGWLYVLAGLAGTPTGKSDILADVWRVPIAADGSLGNWELAGEALPTKLATHAVTAVGDYVFTFGGVEGEGGTSTFTNHVWKALFTANGILAEWHLAPKLPRARSHVHQIPARGNRIYSVAGSEAQEVKTAVDVGRIN